MRARSALPMVGALLLAAAPLAAPASGAAVTGRVVVSWEPGSTGAERADALRGLTGVQTLPLTGASVVDVPLAKAAPLAAHPAVRAVEPEGVWTASQAADADPALSQQWGLHNTGQAVRGVGGRPGVDIDALAAWALLDDARTGEVTVAVLDSGVDLAHPDLRQHAWFNTDEVPSNGIDDDRNGFVDDVNGWDFVSGDNTVSDAEPGTDEDSHGTHVAGTVAASTGNGLGVAGVAGTVDGVRLMSVKFLGPDGTGSTGDLVRAIAYARDNGARIVNASFGSPAASVAVRDAIAASGMLVVAAAGNGGSDLARRPDYPASYDLPNVVGVAALDSAGRLADYSNYGPGADLAGPGTSIVSTLPVASTPDRFEPYGYLSGTSMAAPHVTGVAALLAAVAPDASAERLAGLLTSTTTPLSELSAVTTTGGLVDARRALAATAPVACPAQPPGQAFSDVPPGPFSTAIDCARRYGLTVGITPTTYGPGEVVSREQMARFLVRLLALAGVSATDPPDAFTDDEESAFEADVDALAALGVVRGTGDGLYRPLQTVTRDQMAAFLARVHLLVTGEELPAGPTPFGDVDTTTELGLDVSRIYTAGLAGGTAPRSYSPGLPVRRDQMAAFLTRETDALVRAQAVTVR